MIYVSPLIVMKIKHSQKYSLGYQTSKFRQNRVAMHNVHNVPVKHHSSVPRPWREGALTMNQTGQSHEPQYKFAFEQLLKKFSQDLEDNTSSQSSIIQFAGNIVDEGSLISINIFVNLTITSACRS